MAIRGKQIGWSQESNLLWQILQGVSNLTKQFSVKCPIPGPPGTKSGAIPPRQIGWSNEAELLWEISRELNRTIAVANNCGNVLVEMENFLGTVTPGYPVGVWNVNDVYLGTAETQDAAATLWNSDPANQAVGQISSGPTPSTFYFEGTTPPDRIRALRYYRYTAPANVQIFIGENDIVKYGSTTKTGLVDGVATNSDTRREWNRYLFGTWNKTKIPTTTVRLLLCSGYLTNQNLFVFHNEDTEYWGVAYVTGFYSIYGAAPASTKGICTMAGQFTTNYNLINNWQELTSLYSFQMLHAGGGPWRYENPAFFPDLYKPSLTQLSFGEMGSVPVPSLNQVASFITETNYPNVSEIVFRVNSSIFTFTGSEDWFLNMPKVDRYLSFVNNSGSGQNTTATADLVWNNIATNLTGITPVVGSQAEIAIRRTSNVSAASLASRTYLATQGWTVIIN